jgi:hypothetical protein
MLVQDTDILLKSNAGRGLLNQLEKDFTGQ